MGMGFQNRKHSGKKINGSKLNVPGQGISSTYPGGSVKAKQDKMSGGPRLGLRGK